MSIISSALLAGFTSLLAAGAETLSFRSGTVEGLVDWQAEDDERMTNFSTRQLSTIAVRVSDVDPKPDPGEVFTLDSLSHRIKSVKRVAQYFYCTCEVSE